MVFAAHSSMSLSTDGGVGCAEIVKGSKLKLQYLPAFLQCNVRSDSCNVRSDYCEIKLNDYELRVRCMLS